MLETSVPSGMSASVRMLPRADRAAVQADLVARGEPGDGDRREDRAIRGRRSRATGALRPGAWPMDWTVPSPTTRAEGR